MFYFFSDDWRADQYKWRNNDVKLYPSKNPIVRKTVFICQVANGATDEFKRISYEVVDESTYKKLIRR